jgi:hypothetical protein
MREDHSYLNNFCDVFQALVARGLDVRAEGVPMVSITNTDFGYAPTVRGWATLDWSKSGNDWIHLADHAAGHEAIAAAIAEHFSATKKSS